MMRTFFANEGTTTETTAESPTGSTRFVVLRDVTRIVCVPLRGAANADGGMKSDVSVSQCHGPVSTDQAYCAIPPSFAKSWATKAILTPLHQSVIWFAARTDEPFAGNRRLVTGGAVRVVYRTFCAGLGSTFPSLSTART